MRARDRVGRTFEPSPRLPWQANIHNQGQALADESHRAAVAQHLVSSPVPHTLAGRESRRLQYDRIEYGGLPVRVAAWGWPVESGSFRLALSRDRANGVVDCWAFHPGRGPWARSLSHKLPKIWTTRRLNCIFILYEGETDRRGCVLRPCRPLGVVSADQLR
jgi:hypothetical protein